MNTIRLNIVNYIFPFLPETKCFSLKTKLLRWSGAHIGKKVRICSSVKIYGSGEIIIGDDVWIGHQCLLVTTSKISIGSHIDIAPKVYIGTGTHKIDKEGLHSAGDYQNIDVIIKDGVWLCTGCTILPGVIIGTKSIVAAGAVVNKNVDPFSIVGGVPAKTIKKIKNTTV